MHFPGMWYRFCVSKVKLHWPSSNRAQKMNMNRFPNTKELLLKISAYYVFYNYLPDQRPKHGLYYYSSSVWNSLNNDLIKIFPIYQSYDIFYADMPVNLNQGVCNCTRTCLFSHWCIANMFAASQKHISYFTACSRLYCQQPALSKTQKSLL